MRRADWHPPASPPTPPAPEAADIIACFESKLYAQNARLDALRWILGLSLVGLGLLVTAPQLPA